MAQDGGLKIQPMEQFEVTPLFGGHELNLFTITNQTLWVALVVTAVSAFFILSMRGRALVPTRMQSMAEIFYGFVHEMVTSILGEEGLKFFPYIFTLFAFILFSNLMGLIPYSFTVTSHVAVTATLALVVFFSVIALGFIRHGIGWLRLFWIEAAPLALRPVLAIIEVISFFIRPVSHSVRLSGNMMAGHSVLQVFGAFIPALPFALLGILPLALMVAVTGLEVVVAIVQAYIFAILTCIYLRDALHPGH